MSDRVIYFPYINVPRNEWFARVLLYWNTIGCILPYDYEPRRHRGIDRFAYTSELIDSGLVEPVRPEEALDIPHFIEAFLALIDNDATVPRGEPLDIRKTLPVKVHIAKLGPILLRELARRELAEPPARGDTWCPVERRTAEVFMAYLALQLGALPEHEMAPITDHAESLAAFSHAPMNDSLAGATLKVREAVLASVLPAPTTADPRDIIRFKDQRADELRGMRKRIERDLRDICLVADESERDARVLLLKQDLQEELEELTQRMQEHGWQDIAWGTLAAVGAAGQVALGAAAHDPMAAAVSLPFFAISLREFVQARATGIEDAPLAYAAFAWKQLGVQ